MNLNKFKNKKVIAGASVLALGASVLLASAFFTDKETNTVRATAGTVDIELTDNSAIDADDDGILNRISNNPINDKILPTIGFEKNNNIFFIVYNLSLILYCIISPKLLKITCNHS